METVTAEHMAEVAAMEQNTVDKDSHADDKGSQGHADKDSQSHAEDKGSQGHADDKCSQGHADDNKGSQGHADDNATTSRRGMAQPSSRP